MAQQPALQLIAEKHPSYLRVLPTPVADAAVKNMLFLRHESFLAAHADMQEVAAAFRKVQTQISTRQAAKRRDVRRNAFSRSAVAGYMKWRSHRCNC